LYKKYPWKISQDEVDVLQSLAGVSYDFHPGGEVKLKVSSPPPGPTSSFSIELLPKVKKSGRIRQKIMKIRTVHNY